MIRADVTDLSPFTVQPKDAVTGQAPSRVWGDVSGLIVGDEVRAEVIDGQLEVFLFGNSVSGGAEVDTAEGTTSGTYTDLATVGPDVTFTAPASGEVVMWLHFQHFNTVANNGGYMSVSVTRVSDSVEEVAPAGARAVGLAHPSTSVYTSCGGHIRVTGLTSGTEYRARCKYARDVGGTANFRFRRLAVEAVA